MNNVSRIFPGANNGLINWMEENFHEIDGFVATFNMKDGTTMTIYDVYSYVQGLGLAEISKSKINELAYDDELEVK